MSNSKDKIRKLFYSTEASNRKLAFELAKEANCYEEMLTEFYTALQDLYIFEEEKSDWLEHMQDIYEDEELIWPTEELELKRLHIEGFCYSYFQEEIYLRGSMAVDRMEHNLQVFPKVVLNCTFVRALDLSWNNLECLPPEIEQLSNLVKLDLSCNDRLKNLPASLANLEHLEELKLYGIHSVLETKVPENELENGKEHRYELPEFFRKMPQLKTLDLGDVYIERLPTWIHEMKGLESLMIFSGSGSNPTLELPSTFTQLSKLALLQINAYTTAIPEDIDQMQSLECLIVEPAVQIPSSIKHLKKLHYLDLSYLSYDIEFDEVEGYKNLFDVSDKGVPEGLSRIKIYGWEWLKEMTQLKEFTFKHIEPYAFTVVEREELQAALPNCKLVLED